MNDSLSNNALLLHANALEHDTPENQDLGQLWLEETLGATVRATAAKSGWKLDEVSDDELGRTIWHRLRPQLTGLLSEEVSDEIVQRAISSAPAENSVDEACIFLVCGFGLDRDATACIAALQLRSVTTPVSGH